MDIAKNGLIPIDFKRFDIEVREFDLFESTRAHQELQYPNRILEFLFYTNLSKGHQRVNSNSCGDVAEDGAKTAQRAVFSSAAWRNPPAPTKNSSIRTGCWSFCFI